MNKPFKSLSEAVILLRQALGHHDPVPHAPHCERLRLGSRLKCNCQEEPAEVEPVQEALLQPA